MDETNAEPSQTQRVGHLVLLTDTDEVRAHCLGAPPRRHLLITTRIVSFHYIFERGKNPATGWAIRVRIPPERKKRVPGQRERNRAIVGHISADFKFLRRGKSLANSDAEIQTFRQFFHLVFERNVLRPAEMKLEALIYEMVSVDNAPATENVVEQ